MLTLSLENILEKAQVALAKTLACKISSSTYMKCFGSDKFDKFSSMQQLERSIGNLLSSYKSPKELAKGVIARQVGNSKQQAFVVMHFLEEAKLPATVNYEVIEYDTKNYTAGEMPDHCMVIIGRKLNSDIKDISTWGKNWVIIDPWVGECFSLENHKEMKVPIFGYSMTCSWYELVDFNSKKFKFVSILSKEAFTESEHCKPCGFGFKSLYSNSDSTPPLSPKITTPVLSMYAAAMHCKQEERKEKAANFVSPNKIANFRI